MGQPLLLVPDELDPFVKMRFLDALQEYPYLFLGQILDPRFCC